ncbi:hypothetical protein C8F04DRAFT_1361661 [Mycena alexandri]|uniref:Uncharacterized protein n=1 Tax=Mycena alexandri TaxID=1745969 RepID=A0AAD6THE7_9AGAR|nr:hypothetical protein C8F04DRAFT_1361661 [Mycena alexandri]
MSSHDEALRRNPRLYVCMRNEAPFTLIDHQRFPPTSPLRTRGAIILYHYEALRFAITDRLNPASSRLLDGLIVAQGEWSPQEYFSVPEPDKGVLRRQLAEYLSVPSHLPDLVVYLGAPRKRLPSGSPSVVEGLSEAAEPEITAALAADAQDDIWDADWDVKGAADWPFPFGLHIRVSGEGRRLIFLSGGFIAWRDRWVNTPLAYPEEEEKLNTFSSVVLYHELGHSLRTEAQGPLNLKITPEKIVDHPSKVNSDKEAGEAGRAAELVAFGSVVDCYLGKLFFISTPAKSLTIVITSDAQDTVSIFTHDPSNPDEPNLILNLNERRWLFTVELVPLQLGALARFAAPWIPASARTKGCQDQAWPLSTLIFQDGPPPLPTPMGPNQADLTRAREWRERQRCVETTPLANPVLDAELPEAPAVIKADANAEPKRDETVPARSNSDDVPEPMEHHPTHVVADPADVMNSASEHHGPASGQNLLHSRHTPLRPSAIEREQRPRVQTDGQMTEDNDKTGDFAVAGPAKDGLGINPPRPFGNAPDVEKTTDNDAASGMI